MARRSSAGTTPGDVLLQEVRQKLSRRSWPPGVTLLTGDDLFHLDATQKALLESLVPEDVTDFSMSVFGQEPVDVSKVVASARSRPMFATRRVVLVREVGALEGEPDPLVAYAQRPPSHSFLLVRAPELDQRRKLHRTLAQVGTLLMFSLSGFTESRQLQVMAGLAADRRLTLERSAAAFLNEACAGEFYRIAGELDKIRAWLGGEGQQNVTLEVAQEIAAGSGMMSGWEVAEAILMRDEASALAAARRLVEAGQEPIRILGGLSWRARTMLQAKAMLEHGADRNQVIDRLRAWAYKNRLLHGLPRYSLQELLRFPALLLEADRALKSRSIDPRAVLELLVEKLTGAAHGVRSE